MKSLPTKCLEGFLDKIVTFERIQFVSNIKFVSGTIPEIWTVVRCTAKSLTHHLECYRKRYNHINENCTHWSYGVQER